MMIRLLFLLAALVAPSALQAQNDDPPIGSRLGKRPQTSMVQSTRQSVQAAHKLLGCTYLKQPTESRAALDAVDAKEAERRFNKLGGKGTCLNLMIATDGASEQQFSLPHDLYRGVLAEAALRQGGFARSLEAVERQPSYSAPWFAVTSRPVAVDEMAACVADTNPAGIRALLATTAETPEEKTAFAALSPSLGPCLTVGAKLNANKQSLRAALAEALYHRAVAPPVAKVVEKAR